MKLVGAYPEAGAHKKPGTMSEGKADGGFSGGATAADAAGPVSSRWPHMEQGSPPWY